MQLEQLTAFQIRGGKVPHDAGDAEAAQGKLHDHVARGQFDLRMQGCIASQKELVHIAARAAVFLQADDRQLPQAAPRNCLSL